MQQLLLSCESTIDLPYTYAKQRNLNLIHYTYSIDEIEYLDDMGKNEESISKYYKLINSGKNSTTNQISVFRYVEHFKKLLDKGDVLHIALSSNITFSYQNALKAKKILEGYNNNKLIIVDSLASSSGYGLIVDKACDMRDANETIENIVLWIKKAQENVNYEYISNESESIIDALKEMVKNAINGINYAGKCFISHCNNLDSAVEIKNKISNLFPKIKDIKISQASPAISSNEGAVSIYYLGK